MKIYAFLCSSIELDLINVAASGGEAGWDEEETFIPIKIFIKAYKTKRTSLHLLIHVATEKRKTEFFIFAQSISSQGEGKSFAVDVTRFTVCLCIKFEMFAKKL